MKKTMTPTIHGVSLDDIGTALNHNFKISFSPQKGVQLERGPYHIWAISSGYQSAEIVKGKFTNHKKFENLGDAIRRDW